MSKVEKGIIGGFLGLTCVLLAFVFCWWSAAVVHMLVPGVSVNAVIVTAMLGLGIGIVLDACLLPRWIRRFYEADRRWMAAIYVGLCVVATGFFMGVPVGTFGLGLLTGVYSGRRAYHEQSGTVAAREVLRRTAFLAAVVTAGAALPIGLLALGDRSSAELLRGLLRLDPEAWGGAAGILLVCLLCAVLFAAQYWGSLLAGWLTFKNSR